jgi:hypothetical protein
VNTISKNNDFHFTMPLTKNYTDDDGYLHVEFGLSTTVKDLQEDEMTENALNEAVEELKKVQLVINDGHNHRLKDLIGPTTNAWIEGNDMFVDLKVRKMWEDEIQDLLDSGTPLGGSIEGRATKRITKKVNGISKTLIDGVKLRGGALTDIPAAWNLRGTAREAKTCEHSLCSQIKKSLDSDFEIKKEAQILALDESASYEAHREKLRAAINDKYPDKPSFWIRNTWPNAVIAESYEDNQNYVIPYSLDENGEVSLGEPREADNIWIAKMAKFYEEMLKDMRGDTLTEIEIPEGVDLTQEEVTKIKSLKDKGVDFIKAILGVEEQDPKDPDPDTGGGAMEKTLTEDDIKKMIDEKVEAETSELKKTVGTLTEENKELKKDNEELKKDKADEIHKTLVKTAIEYSQKLDEDTEIKDEESLMKALEDEFTEDELKEDADTCIKTYNRGLKLALQKTADGPVPKTTDKPLKKEIDRLKERGDELEKRLRNHGREEGGE